MDVDSNSDFNNSSEFEDWRPGLAQLLQPVPFPDEALVDDVFIKSVCRITCVKSLLIQFHLMLQGNGDRSWIHRERCPLRSPSVRAGYPRRERRLVPRHLPFNGRVLRRWISLGLYRNRFKSSNRSLDNNK